MENTEISKEIIYSVLESSKEGLSVDNITTHVLNYLNEKGGIFEDTKYDFESTKRKVNAILNREAKKPEGEFAKAKNPKTKKDRKGVYKIRPKKKDIKIIPEPVQVRPDIVEIPIEEKEQPLNLYKGKAGEYAVMAELLFRGYNVNNMAVDDGIDVVASKNNLFYYIQVKTTDIKQNNTISARIDWKRYSDYIGNQMRYIIVIRCKIKNIETNVFFKFTNEQIDQLIYEKKVKRSTISDNILIKIEIDPNTGDSYIYDEKKSEANYYMNKFDL